MTNPHLIVLSTNSSTALREFNIDQIREYVVPRFEAYLKTLRNSTYVDTFISHSSNSDYYDVRVLLTRPEPQPDDELLLQGANDLAQELETELYEKHIITSIFVSLRTVQQN